MFYFPAPLWFVVAGTVALGLISFTPSQWMITLRCLLRPNGGRSCGERRLAAGVFRMMAAYAIGTGAIGTLDGLVVLLQNIDDPSSDDVAWFGAGGDAYLQALLNGGFGGAWRLP